MRNVQGAGLYRYNKVRMAFNFSLKLFNLRLKLQCSYTQAVASLISRPKIGSGDTQRNSVVQTKPV